MVQRIARALGRLSTSRQYRSLMLLRLTGAPNLFQHASMTRENRYPPAFRFARETIGDGHDVRILSFGCSTGEEVFSLRHYFPAAAIRGLDINRGSIALCKKRLRERPDPRISFAVADSPLAEPANAYDAIFCMSVLRNGELCETKPRSSERLMRFAEFEAMTALFAERVKPGGLLAIANCNFRFCDTIAFADFEVAFSRPASPDERPTPIYGRDNILREGEVYRDIMFRKRRAAAATDEERR